MSKGRVRLGDCAAGAGSILNRPGSRRIETPVCGRNILRAVAEAVVSGFALHLKRLSGTKLAACGAAREPNPKVKHMSLTDDKLRQTITSTADLAGASLVTRIVVNRLRMQVRANPAKLDDKVLELKAFFAQNPDAAREFATT